MVLGLRQKLGISVFIETTPAVGAVVMHICGAKFQEHCLNTFRVIVYLVFYHFLVANLMTSSLI